MFFKKKIVLPDTDHAQFQFNDVLQTDHVEVSLQDLSQYLSTKMASKTLIVFIGGAMDDRYRPLYHGVFLPFRLRQQADSQDTCYATHATTKLIIPLIKHWSKAGQKVCIVGHSWGGNSALRIARELPQTVIDLLVTLDPVSRRYLTRQTLKPENVNHWINVHIDYSKASMEYSNVIARLGGAWTDCPNADSNIKLSNDQNIEITHVMANRMFEEVAEEVSKL